MQNIRISVLAIIVITLAVGFLVALINGIAYSRHLDKVVSGEERNVRTRIVEPGTAMGMVLTGLLCIWVLISLTKISTLNDRVEQLRMDMSNGLNSLQAQVAALEAALDDQSAIVAEYDYSFGAIDWEQRSVAMGFRVALKAYDENARVSLSFGAQSTELTAENGVFVGSIPVGLFEGYANPPVLSVKSGTTTETQILRDCPYGSFAEMCIPTVEEGASSFTTGTSKKGMVTVSGWADFYDAGSKVEGLSITGTDVVVKLGDEELKRTPLNLSDGREERVEIENSFSAEDGRVYGVYLEMHTNVGWVIAQTVMRYDSVKDGLSDVSGEVTVTDETGAVLYSTALDEG